MEKLIKILERVKPGVDFRNTSGLVDNRIITSIDVVSIASKIDRAFEIELSVADITPENFNSAAAMMAMIEKNL